MPFCSVSASERYRPGSVDLGGVLVSMGGVLLRLTVRWAALEASAAISPVESVRPSIAFEEEAERRIISTAFSEDS